MNNKIFKLKTRNKIQQKRKRRSNYYTNYHLHDVESTSQYQDKNICIRGYIDDCMNKTKLLYNKWSHQNNNIGNNDNNTRGYICSYYCNFQRRSRVKIFAKKTFFSGCRLCEIRLIWNIILVNLCILYFSTLATQAAIMLNSDQNIDDEYFRSAIRVKYTPPSRLNRCYSCMSAMYEPFFRTENSHLAKFFYEPRNFTVHCDDATALNIYNIGVVPCRAICLTLTQEFTVMGRKTGKQLTMRGCATSLSRYGFYNRTFAIFDQYDLCREVLANELFRYDTDSQPIRVCSCLGDRCNGSAAGPSSRNCETSVALACIFIATTFLNCRKFVLIFINEK